MYVEFIEGEKHGGSSPDISDFHEGFKSCGKTLEKDEICVDIDVLPKKSIEKLIETFGIHTQVVWSERGAHLHFKRPKNMKSKEGICHLGFKVELLTKEARPNGICIKRGGVMRQIDNPGIFQPLPDFFRVNGKYDKNLAGMQEGDGRNNALFAHNNLLTRFKIEQREKILDFINSYVFAEPLKENEFDSVSREPDSDKSKGTVSNAGDRLIKEYRLKKYNGSLWFWDQEAGRYSNDKDELEYLTTQIVETKTSREVDEALKWAYKSLRPIPKDASFHVSFKNGYLEDGHWYEGINDDFTPYSIDFEYYPDAEIVPEIDEYLDQIARSPGYSDEAVEEYKKLILEMMAYGFVVDPTMTNKLCRFFMLRGEGANGKGTLMKIMRAIYQKANCSFLSIEQIGKESYCNRLDGKMLNLGDDIESKTITKEQWKMIKNITAADSTMVRRLYENATEVMLIVKLIFTSNTDIRTIDKGYALERRLRWMPMFNVIKKPDPHFLSRMTTNKAIRYWLRLIVEAYKRLYENENWTVSLICEQYNERYFKHNDLTKMFIEETDTDDLVYKTMDEIEIMFNEWNTTDDRKFSKKSFKRNVWDMKKMGFGKKSGYNKRILLLQEETNQDLKPTYA